MHREDILTKLIHENFSVVMAFAYSQPSLANALNEQLEGGGYLRRSCIELAEERADRALLEVATQLRLLDDRQDIARALREAGAGGFGIVLQNDDRVTDLHLRDLTNKIAHAARFEWRWGGDEPPSVVCHPHNAERWKRAEINLLSLAGFVSNLDI